MDNDEFKFTGWFIPKDIVHLFDDGVLTASELLLLAMVDSLSKKSEKGCFASNQYFADRLRIKQDTASRLIARLIKMELLMSVAFDGRRRYLATSWSADTHARALSIRSRLGRQSDADSDENPIPSSLKGVITDKKNMVARKARHEKLRGGFLGGDTPPTFEEKAAKKLEEHIRQKRNLTCVPSPKKWVKDIQALLKSLGGDKSRLKRVLIWYTKNSDQAYVPRIHSAHDFAAKFTKIEDQMGRKEVPPDEVVMTREGADLYKRISTTLAWPSQMSAAALRESIELSLLAYRAWRTAAVATKGEGDQSWQDYVSDLEWSLLTNPWSFVDSWYNKVHGQVGKWKDWNGDVSRYTWHPEHKLFQKMGLQNATAYAGAQVGADYWKKLMENAK